MIRPSLLVPLALALVVTACASSKSVQVTEIRIEPREATVAPGGTAHFKATLIGDAPDAIALFDVFDDKGDPCVDCGSVSADGVFTAGAKPGTVYVHARSSKDIHLFARAKVVVVASP